MPDYKFDNIVIELRYNNSLFFNDMQRLKNITDNLFNILPQSTYDSNQKILIMGNPDKHFDANVRENICALSYNEPESFEDFKNVALKFTEVVTREMDIKFLNRLGIRALRGIEKKNLKEAVNYVRKNMIKLNDSILRLLSPDIESCYTGFMFKTDGMTVNLNIKPNQVNIVEVENNVVKRNINRSEVLVDSDTSKEKINILDEKFDKLIDKVIDINESKIDNFIKKVSIY